MIFIHRFAAVLRFIGWKIGFIFFASNPAWAQFKVNQLIDFETVEIVRTSPESEKVELRKNDRLVIYSLTGKKVVGYLKPLDLPENNHEQALPSKLKARVILREDNGLILPGDEVRKIDLRKKTPEYPGRVDLAVKGKTRASARLKPLMYQGATLGETAETLDKNEHLVDVALFYFYGLTDRFTVASWLPVNFLKQPNLKVKYKIVDNKWMVISQSFLSLYSFRDGEKGFYNQLITYLDLPNNTKSTSHTQIKIAFDPEVRLKRKTGGSFGQSTIQSGYQYVFDNWDRLLYGPVYNFDTGAVGGFVSYMMIWDHTHAMLTLETRNLTRFKLDVDEGYFASAYLYWRF